MNVPCRACGAPTPPEAERCPRCNTALGPLAPCPHCRAEAGFSPDDELRFVCDVCGGPRVPRRGGEPAGRGELGLLQAADRARKSRALWRFTGATAGLASAAVGGLTTLGAILLSVLGVISGGAAFGLIALVGLFVAAPLGLLALAGFRKNAAYGEELKRALDGAWLAAASAALRSGPPAQASATLTKQLRVDEDKADELLTMLETEEAAGGVFAPPRVRVAAEVPPTRLPDLDDDAALLEQALAEEQAAEAAAAARAGAKKP